jgi:hypothetical protein
MAAGTYLKLYQAVAAMIDDVEAAVSAVITAAPTNFGDDFRITPGAAVYQTRVVGEIPFLNSNVSYRRAIVEVAIHDFVRNSTDELVFMALTMQEVADRFLDGSYWRAESGIFNLEPDVDPEISDGERVGNVISFVVTASVLMDPA